MSENRRGIFDSHCTCTIAIQYALRTVKSMAVGRTGCSISYYL